MSRILFADGEPHIRQLCLEELQDEGYEVKVTGKAAEVVRLVDSFQPDMVIMEVVLPDMSGLETGRMIKGTNRKTRVLLYSHISPPGDLSCSTDSASRSTTKARWTTTIRTPSSLRRPTPSKEP